MVSAVRATVRNKMVQLGTFEHALVAAATGTGRHADTCVSVRAGLNVLVCLCQGAAAVCACINRVASVVTGHVLQA